MTAHLDHPASAFRTHEHLFYTFTTVLYWGDGGGGHWLVRMKWCPDR